jgi:hypothetical protein
VARVELREMHTKQQTVDRYANVQVIRGVVHNVVARLPGTAPHHAQRPALLLAAHYDLATCGSAGAGPLHAVYRHRPVAALLAGQYASVEHRA